MQHRTLGRTGLSVSVVSLGTEYLYNAPREHIVEVIRAALARGINLFDLFFAQAAFRDDMGVAFEGHREQALLIAHLGAIETDGQEVLTRDRAVSERYMADFLERFRTDYVDILLVHNSDGDEDYAEVMRPGGLMELAEQYRDRGQARHIGLSGHTAHTCQQAAESGRVDVLMFPVNLAGNAIPGRRAMLEACVAHHVGLVAMKPYGGGRLLRPGDDVHIEQWQAGGREIRFRRTRAATPVQCLAYALDQPGVSCVIPGCKDLEELGAAVAYLEADAAARDYAPLLADYAQYVSGECVYCNHCLPCPQAIDIGQTMRLHDLGRAGVTPALREAYDAMATAADDCIACGDCEARCPFGVQVVPAMERAAALFG